MDGAVTARGAPSDHPVGGGVSAPVSAQKSEPPTRLRTAFLCGKLDRFAQKQSCEEYIHNQNFCANIQYKHLSLLNSDDQTRAV